MATLEFPYRPRVRKPALSALFFTLGVVVFAAKAIYTDPYALSLDGQPTGSTLPLKINSPSSVQKYKFRVFVPAAM